MHYLTTNLVQYRRYDGHSDKSGASMASKTAFLPDKMAFSEQNRSTRPQKGNVFARMHVKSVRDTCSPPLCTPTGHHSLCVTVMSTPFDAFFASLLYPPKLPVISGYGIYKHNILSVHAGLRGRLDRCQLSSEEEGDLAKLVSLSPAMAAAIDREEEADPLNQPFSDLNFSTFENVVLNMSVESSLRKHDWRALAGVMNFSAKQVQLMQQDTRERYALKGRLLVEVCEELGRGSLRKFIYALKEANMGECLREIKKDPDLEGEVCWWSEV